MKKKYDYDKDWYMHGLCQYFAIEYVKLFGGRVWLCIDYDYDLDCPCLCHAFVEVRKGQFLDAYGYFSDPDERMDEEFEYNEKNYFTGTLDEVKRVLRSMKVPYGNEEHKKNVREFLKENFEK